MKIYGLGMQRLKKLQHYAIECANVADNHPGIAPVVHGSDAVDFSVRSPRVDEIEEVTNRFITRSKLTLPLGPRRPIAGSASMASAISAFSPLAMGRN
ncbi:hypothetical protein [Microvirga yunnanensis]|uniref:hypothetical protein n=1 Tax=Microvirga yunnanensis TaxID=2953740 RepID=UPI0021C712B7|nr:hypothetical protein [Microvirga sp. HBU65207]